MSTTSKFLYAHWTRTVRTSGEIVWVESFEAASHFLQKDALLADMRALRSLEMMAVKAEVNSDTQNALDYIQSQMIAVSEKIIKINRKLDRNGWYAISDEHMQKHIARHNEGKAA